MQHLGYCGPLKEDDCSSSAHVASTLRASEEKGEEKGGLEGEKAV